ncbi:MAG: hypothetical protein MZV65_48525 [Chromatiales bacterium]|nr:hypothetical protein [Chromatiales bacterium]
MHPAFSVIFLTTLIGAGQGLFLALYTAQIYVAVRAAAAAGRPASTPSAARSPCCCWRPGWWRRSSTSASPERAWRSAAKWRTSWLSREVIVLPAFMGAVFALRRGALARLEPGARARCRAASRSIATLIARRARHAVRLRALRLHRR